MGAPSELERARQSLFDAVDQAMSLYCPVADLLTQPPEFEIALQNLWSANRRHQRAVQALLGEHGGEQ